MTPMAIILTYSIIWIVVFFISLPIGIETDEHEENSGLDAGAPKNHNMTKKFLYSMIISAFLTMVYYYVVTGPLNSSEI